jgi:aspartate/methionine/tyrosine aminotransferase
MTLFPSDRLKGIDKTLIRQINDRADASCINLGLGELDFPTPAALLERVSAELNSWPMGYTANAGLPELRALIAERSGSGLTAEHVCVTIGAEEAIFAVLMVLVNAGDEVLVPDPGFPAYAAIVRMAGGIPVGYALPPETHFALDAEEAARRITPRTRVLVINSPHNPTGAVFSGEELSRLAGLCRRHGLIALSDEVYREIVFEGRAESLSDYYEPTVVINSLSKTYSMTGWRLGWCVAHPELIRMLGTFNQLAISCPPAVCQRAAILALQGVADEEKKKNIEELKKRRDLAARCLDRVTGLKYHKPRGAFYIWADISARLSPSRTALDVALQLIDREKVVAIPGSAFGRSAEGFLRLSFAASPENIEEGIRRIGRFLGRA